MLKILVPIDGSEYSKKALLEAKELATAMGGEITIINIMPIILDPDNYHSVSRFAELEKISSDESKALLDKGIMHFVDTKTKVETASRRGDPANEIINFAEEGRFDLIVMGSRGLGVFKRTLLGSVSDKVVHHANTSVLVVK